METERLDENLPQPRAVTKEVTIFAGWIYDHLLHAQQVKVARPLMLRAIAAAKKEE